MIMVTNTGHILNGICYGVSGEWLWDEGFRFLSYATSRQVSERVMVQGL